MDELKESISGVISKKLASPILLTYIICWLFWNYDVVLVTLSGIAWDSKNLYINRMVGISFDGDNIHKVWDYLIPLVVSLLYILLLPIIDTKIYVWVKKIEKKNKEEKLKANDETPISKAEMEKIVDNFDERKRKLIEDRKDKEVEVSELESQLNFANSKLKDKEDELENLMNQIKGVEELKRALKRLENENREIKESGGMYETVLEDLTEEQQKERYLSQFKENKIKKRLEEIKNGNSKEMIVTDEKSFAYPITQETLLILRSMSDEFDEELIEVIDDIDQSYTLKLGHKKISEGRIGMEEHNKSSKSIKEMLEYGFIEEVPGEIGRAFIMNVKGMEVIEGIENKRKMINEIKNRKYVT